MERAADLKRAVDRVQGLNLAQGQVALMDPIQAEMHHLVHSRPSQSTISHHAMEGKPMDTKVAKI